MARTPSPKQGGKQQRSAAPLGTERDRAAFNARDADMKERSPMTHTTPSGLLEGLTVFGEATRNASPDIIELSLDVHSAGPTAGHALRENTMKTTQIGQALIGLGVPKSDVQAGAPALWPMYQPAFPQLGQAPGFPQLPPIAFGSPGPLAQFAQMAPELPQIAGFHAVSFLKVSVHDASRLGDLIDTATRAGANIGAGFLFRMRDEPALRRSLLEQAGRDAREKAETLASVTGRTVGDAVSVYEDFTAYQVHSGYGNGYRSGPFAMAPTGTIMRLPVSPGELTFHARVSVTYRWQ